MIKHQSKAAAAAAAAGKTSNSQGRSKIKKSGPRRKISNSRCRGVAKSAIFDEKC